MLWLIWLKKDAMPREGIPDEDAALGSGLTKDVIIDPSLQAWRDSVTVRSREVRGGVEVRKLDERLKTLVVDAADALPEDDRTVRGKVRTGEEIALAIPDVEAFLAEVDLQKKDGILLNFFELNKAGQLVMKDDRPEAYGLGDNAVQAKI